MLIKYFVACSRYNKIQKMDYLLVNPMLNHKTQHIFKFLFLCYNNCKNYTLSAQPMGLEMLNLYVLNICCLAV